MPLERPATVDAVTAVTVVEALALVKEIRSVPATLLAMGTVTSKSTPDSREAETGIFFTTKLLREASSATATLALLMVTYSSEITLP